ncbi:arsenite efflux transporter metallochaperone ArsD [Pseudomonadota bacterium]
MATLTVYDPPLCCTSGVCGPTIDPKLAQFAGNLDWLRTQGVTIQRYNLAQEPERFVENRTVKAILDKSGGDDLPAILVGETLVSSGRFPSRNELAVMVGLETTDPAVEPAGDCDGGQGSSKPEATADGCGCGPNTAGCS